MLMNHNHWTILSFDLASLSGSSSYHLVLDLIVLPTLHTRAKPLEHLDQSWSIYLKRKRETTWRKGVKVWRSQSSFQQGGWNLMKRIKSWSIWFLDFVSLNFFSFSIKSLWLVGSFSAAGSFYLSVVSFLNSDCWDRIHFLNLKELYL